MQERNEKLSDEWRPGKLVVPEAHTEADLYDMLSSTYRPDTYQWQSPDIPSLLRPLSPIMCELPAMVMEKYATCQTMCFNGIFPQIGRAWASIDNALFLWRYDRSNDVPVKYCGEEQTICCVGLVKPKPQVFMDSIQHVLVICTASEVVLLGVHTDRGSRPGGAEHEELLLQPLPEYALATDNVIMCCAAASAAGRIFLGGSDGHVYEVRYEKSPSWLARSRKISKVCLTAGLKSYLPGFLPKALFGRSSAVEQLVVDDERHILYALLTSAPGGTGNHNSILMFDLGEGGTGDARRVAEVPDFLAAAASATPRDVFVQKKGSAVKCLTPIPCAESSKLHLLAVTADGRRLYFKVYPQAPYEAEPKRPSVLQALLSRAAVPPSGPAAGSAVNPLDLPRSGSMEVTAALYSRGCLLLAESVGSEARSTKLIAATRNLTLPQPTSTAGAGSTGPVASNIPPLRELVTALDSHIAGEACALVAVPSEDVVPGELQLVLRSELVSQVYSPPQRFVLLSTVGVLQLEKLRPVDALLQLLQEDRPVGGAAAGAAAAAAAPKKLAEFFNVYGAAEAAAMCIIVATMPRATEAVQEAALRALDNPALVNEPQMPEDMLAGAADGLPPPTQPPPSAAGLQPPAAAGSFFMGGVLVQRPLPVWSAAHQGLCLHVSRLLHPVWEGRVVRAGGRAGGALTWRILPATMKAVELKLKALEQFLHVYQRRLRQRGQTRGRAEVRQVAPYGPLVELQGQPAAKRQRMMTALSMEEQRTQAVRQLVEKSVEALVLLQTLAASNFPRLVAKLEQSERAQLAGLTLKELVDGEGWRLASSLVKVLVEESQESSSVVVDDVTAHLQRECPSYFKDSDKLYYSAMAKLRAAEVAEAVSERAALAREAVPLLLKAAAHCQPSSLAPRLASLQQWEGLVEIAIRAAAARDPANCALHPELGLAECSAARQQRNACYGPMLSVLEGLMGSGSGSAQQLGAAERQAAKQLMLQRAAQSKDAYFHQVLYSFLADSGAGDELLALDTPQLAGYLASEGGLPAGGPGRQLGGGRIGPLSGRQARLLELLAKLYISKGRHQEAAQVYLALATRANGDDDKHVSLAQRQELLTSALSAARSTADVALQGDVQNDAEVVAIQAQIAQRLPPLQQEAAGRGDEAAAAELRQAAADISAEIKDVSTLYNSYCSKYRLWDLCLEICHFSGQVDPFICRQLWDLLLKEQADREEEAGGARRQQLEAMAAWVERLGPKFHPNEGTFPAPFIALRLEQAAAGLWPSRAEALEPSDLVVAALRRGMRGSTAAAQRTYEVLLARRGSGILEAEELAAPALRARLLRSLLALCYVAKEEGAGRAAAGYGGGGVYSSHSRWLGGLADACDRYVHEARLLPAPDGDELAAAFEQAKQELLRG